MGLFNFLKRKNKKQETEKVIDISTYGKKSNVSGEKAEAENNLTNTEQTALNVNKDFAEKDKEDSTFIYKNEQYGIEVHTSVHEETNIFSEPYNEVKAYVEFMNKYELIDSPQTHSPIDYVYFQFLNAGLHGIPDVRKCHEELFSKGFYEECDTPAAFLEGMKVSELKDLAKKIRLEVKGKKAVIIEAISNATTYEQLKSLLGYGVYHPSKKADEYKKEHQIEIEYYFLLKDQNISFDVFSEERKTRSLDDINFPMYKNSAKHDDFYFGTSDYEWIAEYYRRNGKLKKTAEFYLKIFFIELSGIQLNNVNWHEFKKDRVPKENWRIWNIEIDDNIIKKISELKEQIDDDLVSKVTNLKYPFSACPHSLFNQIIQLIKDDRFDDMAKEKVTIALNTNLEKIRKDLYGF